MTPQASVRIASQVAARHAGDAPIRAIAAQIVAPCENVPEEGPRRIAEWVRANILYTQEAPGEEILQGPHTTLRIRTGDCDDLAILWAALCRSVGIDATVAGLKRRGSNGYFHAMGYFDGELYELSLDHTYGGQKRPMMMGRADVPTGVEAHVYDPASRRLRPVMGSGGLGTAGDIMAEVDAGLSQAGIRLSGETLFGRSGVATAANEAAGAAAAGASAYASVVGMGAAAVPVGVVVAAAAALAFGVMAAARASKFRKRAMDRGIELLQVIDAIVELTQPPSEHIANVLHARLMEGLPYTAGTHGRRGRGRRRVQLATTQDARPRGEATWVDGRGGKRRGVYETFRRGHKAADRMAQAMASHLEAAFVLAESMAQLPLAQRRQVLGGFIVYTLGQEGLRDLPPAYDPARRRRSSLPLVAVGGAALVAALAALALG